MHIPPHPSATAVAERLFGAELGDRLISLGERCQALRRRHFLRVVIGGPPRTLAPSAPRDIALEAMRLALELSTERDTLGLEVAQGLLAGDAVADPDHTMEVCRLGEER